jgi:hypothetical protein
MLADVSAPLAVFLSAHEERQKMAKSGAKAGEPPGQARWREVFVDQFEDA